MADGFVSRWARKKQLDQAIEKSARVVETDSPADSADLVDDQRPAPSRANATIGAHQANSPAAPGEQIGQDEPAPDVEQAKQLPIGADVSRYMKADVPEEARREALQKLFSDPMYNVISEMDDYVEDYSNLPNLSREELKTLNHVKGLFLFEDPPWKIEAEREERLAAEEALRRQAAAGADPLSGKAAEPTPESNAEPTLEGTGASTITVSPPPPHLSRLKPAEVKGKDDPFATPEEDAAEPVALSGRRYQPTRRQDPS
jgi:hypothetical protein